MRPVYFYGAISLDGYLVDTHDDLSWLVTSDLAGQDTYTPFSHKIDTAVMGRITYDVSRELAGSEPLCPGLRQVVLSRTRVGAPYRAGAPAAIVQDLRQEPGAGIWIVGGGGLVRELLEADLIDEWWLQIVPVLLGSGKRLFEPGDYQARLELVDTTPMGELTELHLRRRQ